LEIVHGEKEAKIIYASHAEINIDKSKNYLYIDVGGGSTELSLISSRRTAWHHNRLTWVPSASWITRIKKKPGTK
jgi:exopolyphosphatase/pppGpp-phosphohydrolase